MKKFLLLVLFTVTACDVKIKNFEKYSKAPLLELEEMPSKDEVKKTMPRVLITAQTPQDEIAKKANAHTIIAKDVAVTLNEDKFASVIEREYSQSAKQEIKISELSGNETIDTKAIDYIVDIGVSNVTFSRQNVVVPVPIVTNNGVSVGTRPAYQYTSAADGVIKIYKLPKMDILKTINIKGSYIESENVASSGTRIKFDNFALENSSNAESKAYDSNITYKAIKFAGQNAIRELKNFFKKTGYIIERRTLKKKNIFAINLGEENGIKTQDKVIITRTTTTHNPLTDEDEETQEQLCKGTVADKVFKNRSWIVFEKDCQSKVRLGDKVQIIY